MKRNIYLASSWRNAYQQETVQKLRAEGHTVYDFRNPPGNTGFGWSQTDPDYKDWSVNEYLKVLDRHPVAQRAFESDAEAMRAADTFVCLLPSGRSAHLEAGWAIGQGKETFFLIYPEQFEPELMYKLGSGCYSSIEPLLERLRDDPKPITNTENLDWFFGNRGNTDRGPAPHALKLLSEALELCRSLGCARQDIIDEVIHKLGEELQDPVPESERTPENQRHELADCQMCLDIVAQAAGVVTRQAVHEKMAVLRNRQYQPDEDGVLRR